MQEIFTDIYRRNLWAGSESVSGPGSGLERTAVFKVELAQLLQDFAVHTLLDAPCGDFNWMREVPLSLEHYFGIDIVEELIVGNRQKYGSADRTFLCGDMTLENLPRTDLILCRDGLVHFSFAAIHQTLQNFKSSGSKYLLTSTFINIAENDDIPTGGWRQLNLEIAPFNFPPPLSLIDEKCTHTNGRYRDKRLALWELSSL